MPITRVIIHAEPAIRWHALFAPKVAEGLRSAGVPYMLTRSRERIDEGLALLLGTTSWRQVEASGPFLLFDRCSFGKPSEWMTIVLNGHGRRGDHRTPDVHDASRWERHRVELADWIMGGSRTILCGQTETYSPHYTTMDAWYGEVAGRCTHFRPHPAARAEDRHSRLCSSLAHTTSWDDARVAVTLNSSVAVDAVLSGIPAVTMDEAAMAWDVTSHSPEDVVTPARDEWLHWLAWTQWTHDEIRSGVPWPRFL
jgi:hypothetical protein